jgi:hypothetical protein
MSSKRRGSVKGLQQNREELKTRNTERMTQVILSLEIVKPDELWSLKEVWSGAGLKSNVALDSPWNKHIREAVASHNAAVKERMGVDSRVYPEQTQDLLTVDKLKSALSSMKSQRDSALSRIAIYQAEADFFRRKCEGLITVNQRLRGAQNSTGPFQTDSLHKP